MNTPLVTINLVVYNGVKYVIGCLTSIRNQSYRNFEVNILNNASIDQTANLVQEFISLDPRFTVHNLNTNLGMWPGQEELLKYSSGKYIVAVSVDVLMDVYFVVNVVKTMESDPAIGAVQPKVFQYSIEDGMNNVQGESKNLIDTVGFILYKSRRLINEGQGEVDREQFNSRREIFAVEGAIPVFRREALEDCRIKGQLIDPNFFWYGDDFDIAWRMRVFGWKQVYDPLTIAFHDRSTTKSVAQGLSGHLRRIRTRRLIPIKKRQLDWANTRLAIIKNDFALNIIRDLPYIIGREIAVLAYTIVFEPSVLLVLPRFFKLLPQSLKSRRQIMRRAKVPASVIHRWFK